MKHNWKIFLGIAIVVGLLVGAPVVGHFRAKWALENYRKQLAARGEKLTIEEIAPHPTADARSASVDFLGAARAFGAYPSNAPPSMRSLTPGHAMMAAAEEPLPTSDSVNVWPDTSRQLQLHESQLAELRASLEAPMISFDLDFSQGFNLLLPHLAPAKTAGMWLSVAAMVDLHAGRPTNALADLKSLAALSRPLEREPTMISQLVRAAIGQIGVAPTWEVLQTSGWRDEDLAGLQAAWNSLDISDGIEPSLDMERQMGGMSFELGRSSYANASGMTGNGQSTIDDIGQALADPKGGFEALLGRYPRYWLWKWQWSYEEELYNAQVWQAGLETARAIKAGGAYSPEAKKLDANLAGIWKSHPGAGRRFLFGQLEGSVERYLLKFADLEMERRLLVTAIALKRWQIREGKYPAQLQDLVPRYLPQLPMDSMDGKPLRYQLKPDGTFLLYSVGEDGVDNGGDPNPLATPDASKSWWKGRDAVWPMPATPEEVQAYKDKALAEWKDTEARRKPVRIVVPPATAPATNSN